MSIFKWLQIAGGNDTADSTIDWTEGQSPASVNNSARAMMAAIAKWRDDIGGTLVTAGGPTTYTILVTNQNFTGFASPPPNGTSLTFQINQTNAVNAQLSINSGTPYPLQTSAGTAVTAGLLQANTVYTATFRTTTNAWILNNVYQSAGIVPIGTVMPFAGTADPSTSFLICNGRSLARASYPTLFTSTWGGTAFFGGTAPNFNLPDLRGRVVAGLDATSLQLSTFSITPNPATLGATGGAEAHVIAAAELPAHTHSINDPQHNHSYTAPSNTTGTNALGGVGNTATAGATTGNSSTGITIGNSVPPQTVGTNVLQPTLLLNYIIRVL